MNPVQLPHTGEVILRLAMATLVGCIIGINRELKGKPAGLRTHALVTLGAALMTLSMLHLSADGNVIQTDALSRVIQGIITGIGFLGAGVIIREESGNVRGLTTAATVWISAALGIVCGVGNWPAVITALGLVLLVLMLGGPIDQLLAKLQARSNSEHHHRK